MRYPRSSYSAEELATTTKTLLQGGITSGRVFWLRGLIITNSHASQADQVVINDIAAEGAEAAADRRLTIFCGAINTVALDFPAPGIKFVKGVQAAKLEDPTSGTFPAYGVTVTGYEE